MMQFNEMYIYCIEIEVELVGIVMLLMCFDLN